jgi:geranylgeranyl reductase family protein
MRDVAIIGGGPGGLHAAYRLAQRGWDVAVLEEHAATGDPVHCTGVLATEAFDEFDIPRHAILNPLTTARFFGPSGRSIDYGTAHAEAVVVDRRRFDADLCERATHAGATVHVGVRVNDIEWSDRSIRLHTAPGASIEARACILACGANYTLQRRIGLGIPALYLQSAQFEVPAATPRDLELHFGDIAPKGFAWVVPVYRAHGTFARVGLMCERNARECFDRFLARIAPRWRTGTPADPAAGQVARTKILPLAPIARTFTRRLLAVGDAAGLVKATTGGGIYYSLLSGSLAAGVLTRALDADDLSEKSLSGYETAWRSQLGDELAAQLTLRSIANELTENEIEELFELARTDGVMPIVRRTAAFNRHRHLIVSLLGHPPARRVLMRRVFQRAAPS